MIYLNKLVGATTKWSRLWYVCSLPRVLFSHDKKTGRRFEPSGICHPLQTLHNIPICASQSLLLICLFNWWLCSKDALFDPDELKSLEDIRIDILSYKEYAYPYRLYLMVVKLWSYFPCTYLQENGCKSCRVDCMSRLLRLNCTTYLLLGNGRLVPLIINIMLSSLMLPALVLTISGFSLLLIRQHHLDQQTRVHLHRWQVLRKFEDFQ